MRSISVVVALAALASAPIVSANAIPSRDVSTFAKWIKAGGLSRVFRSTSEGFRRHRRNNLQTCTRISTDIQLNRSSYNDSATFDAYGQSTCNAVSGCQWTSVQNVSFCTTSAIGGFTIPPGLTNVTNNVTDGGFTIPPGLFNDTDFTVTPPSEFTLPNSVEVTNNAGSDDSCPEEQAVFVSIFGSEERFQQVQQQCGTEYDTITNMFNPSSGQIQSVCSSDCIRPILSFLDTAGSRLMNVCPRSALNYKSLSLMINSLVCVKNDRNEYCVQKLDEINNGNFIINSTDVCASINDLGCCGRQLYGVLRHPTFVQMMAQESDPVSIADTTNATAIIGAALDRCSSPGACQLPQYPPGAFTLNSVVSAPNLNVNFGINPNSLNDGGRSQIEQQVRRQIESAVGNGTVDNVVIVPDGSGGVIVRIEFADGVTSSQTEELASDAAVTDMSVTFTDADGTSQSSTSTGATIEATDGSDSSASGTVPTITIAAILVAMLLA